MENTFHGFRDDITTGCGIFKSWSVLPMTPDCRMEVTTLRDGLKMEMGNGEVSIVPDKEKRVGLKASKEGEGIRVGFPSGYGYTMDRNEAIEFMIGLTSGLGWKLLDTMKMFNWEPSMSNEVCGKMATKSSVDVFGAVTVFRATLVDSRDHEVTEVGELIFANGVEQARIKAYLLAGLDAGVFEFYDILLEVIGYVRPKRDQD